MVTSDAAQLLPSQSSNSTANVGLLDVGNQKDSLAGNQNVASTTGSADIITRLRDRLNLNSSLSSPVAKTDLVAQTVGLPNPSNSTTDSIVGNNNTQVGDLKNDSLLTNSTSATGGSTPAQPASPPRTGNSSQNQPVAQSQPAARASVPPATDLLTFPDGFMKSIEEYGAKPDDGIDDTAAIQKALDDGRRDANGNTLDGGDFYGRPKALYFSAGTYDVSNTLNWVGCAVTLQGAGSGKTIIKLKDNASGFGNSAAPKAVIQTPDGNMSFRQFIYDLSVDTGKGNSGAIGIDYISSNVGSMRNVTIKSQDGKGFAGLAMDRNWPGPCLIKNVEIEGFDYGIRVSPGEYGPTFENITLKNQQVAGINNLYGALAIHGLRSTNSVPVINGTSWAGIVTLVDADLQGGAPNVSAIETEGELYARNLTTTGYQSAIKYKGAVVPGTTQTEYASNTSQLFDGPKKSLNLPIKDTPEYHDNNMDNWARFDAGAYGDTSKLQSVLNSGKSTIYFPFDHSAYEQGALLEKNGVYFSYNETVVTVPESVKRIIGFSSVVNQHPDGKNGGGIKFVVEGNSSDPLIIEQFGHGVKVEQKSSRPVVLKDGNYQYTSSPGAGDLFLEDVNIEPLYIQPKQNVWARQLNDEYGGTKIVNNGGNLWILGLKTERTGTVIESQNGAKTELLGGVINPAHQFSAQDKLKAAFVSNDSSTSLVYRLIAYKPSENYDIQVEETRNGETRRILSDQMPQQVGLFAGY